MFTFLKTFLKKIYITQFEFKEKHILKNKAEAFAKALEFTYFEDAFVVTVKELQNSLIGKESKETDYLLIPINEFCLIYNLETMKELPCSILPTQEQEILYDKLNAIWLKKYASLQEDVAEDSSLEELELAEEQECEKRLELWQKLT